MYNKEQMRKSWKKKQKTQLPLESGGASFLEVKNKRVKIQDCIVLAAVMA